MKKVIIGLFIATGLVFGANERAKWDRNQVTTMLGVDATSGEIRLVKTSSDGFLIISGTVSADVAFPSDLLKDNGWVHIINSTMSVVNFPADYPDTALAGKIALCNTKDVVITSGSVSAVQSGDWYIKGGNVNVVNAITASSPTFKATVYQASDSRSISNFPAVQTIDNERTATGDELDLLVSSASYSTINARVSRKEITIQARTANSGNIYLRLGGTSSIATKGIELNPGQSWSSNQYTGAVYILTEPGKVSQNIVYQEIY